MTWFFLPLVKHVHVFYFTNSGSKSEINIDDCVSMPCENNGTCQDLANDFACSCPEFFKGLNVTQ